MLDLEFYLNPKPLLKKSVIYKYTSGVFKNFVKQKVFSCRPETKEISVLDFLIETQISSLFGERTFYLDITKDEYPLVIERMKSLSEDKIFVSCKEDSTLNSKEDFRQEIQEIEKTKTTFKIIFSFLCLQTQITDAFKNKNPLYEKNMEELYSKCEDILSFLQKAEYFTFSCSDGEKWDSSLFRSILPISESKKYYALHENIYFLLTTPSSGAKEQMLKYISEIYAKGQNPLQIINSIYRAIYDICEVSSNNPEIINTFKYKFLSKYSYIPLPRMFYILVKIPEFEHLMYKSSKNFLASIDSMLQNILENMP